MLFQTQGSFWLIDISSSCRLTASLASLALFLDGRWKIKTQHSTHLLISKVFAQDSMTSSLIGSCTSIRCTRRIELDQAIRGIHSEQFSQSIELMELFSTHGWLADWSLVMLRLAVAATEAESSGLWVSLFLSLPLYLSLVDSLDRLEIGVEDVQVDGKVREGAKEWE